MNTKAKTTLIIVSAILFVATLAVNIWYLCVKLYGAEKIIAETYKVGLQTLKDGTQKPFISVNYMSNKNKNGRPLFEIKFNYLLDETKEQFYSQGLQFVYTDLEDYGFVFRSNERREGKYYDRESEGLGYYFYYPWYGNVKSTNWNYASADDFETTYLSTNPINEDSFFKLDLNGKIYGMKFKGHQPINADNKDITYEESTKLINYIYTERDPEFKYLVFGTQFFYNVYFASIDHMFFAYTLINSIASMAPCTNQLVIFEFADLFDYYEYDSHTGVYSKEKIVNTDEIKKLVKNYYCIDLTISDDGFQYSSDSMFNAYRGTVGYNYNKDGITSADYFFGRSVISVNLSYFDYVDTGTINYIKLKLTDSFKQQYLPYKDSIVLDVTIDLKMFDNTQIFDGFTDDCFTGFMYNVTYKGVQDA